MLLIEAGPHFSSIEQTPRDLLDSRAVSVEDHDWHYITEATPGRDFPCKRKVSGGCSAVNGVISLRGLCQDFRAWAAAGNTGWDWEDILPMYKRIENDIDFGYAPITAVLERFPFNVSGLMSIHLSSLLLQNRLWPMGMPGYQITIIRMVMTA